MLNRKILYKQVKRKENQKKAGVAKLTDKVKFQSKEYYYE